MKKADLRTGRVQRTACDGGKLRSLPGDNGTNFLQIQVLDAIKTLCLARSFPQHVVLADVLSLDKERLQDSVAVIVALDVLLDVWVALIGQVRVRLR